MKEVYLIKKENGALAEVDKYPWGGDYRPRTTARLTRSDTALNLHMRCYEANTRAEILERNGRVCTDSCLEFFFAPVPAETLAYFNFEVNPLGVMYIGFSPDGTRADSRPLECEPNAYFNMRADRNAQYWEVSYSVPYSFICHYMPQFDPRFCHEIHGNFYKCGDLTEHIHYAAWNPVDAPAPDFHVPESFGVLKFE